MPKLAIPPDLIWIAGTWSWVWPLLALAVYGLLIMLIHRRVTPRVQAWVLRSPSPWDNILLNSTGWPLLMLYVIGGIVLLFNLWPIRTNTHEIVLAVAKACFLLLIVSFAHQFLNNWFRSSPPGSVLRLTILRKLLLFAVYVTAFMMVLSIFGYHIEGVITTLGVGSLAVGLAAQQVLSNFFAGLQLSIDQPLEIGQSVQLENGMEGEVITIGWMKTWLRAADGSRLLIPNSKLTGFTIRNYTLGRRGPALLLKLPVDRTADLQKAEDIAREIALDVTRRLSPGGKEVDRRMQPSVQYTEMTAQSAIMTVTLYASDYKTAAATRSEFVKLFAAGLVQANIRLVPTT